MSRGPSRLLRPFPLPLLGIALASANLTSVNPALANSPCPNCVVSDANEKPTASPCEDLFSAACLNADGTPKQGEREKERFEALLRPVLAAREATAKKMGFESVDQALRTKLAEAGLEVLADPNPSAWAALKRESKNTQSSSGEAGSVFAAAAACEREAEELTQPIAKDATAEGLRALRDRMDAFRASYQERSIRLHARDLPNFLSSHVSQKCSTLELNPGTYPPKDNPEIANVCADLPRLKRGVIALFRQESAPGYAAKAEDYVRANWLPAPRASAENSAAPTNRPPLSEAAALRLELERASFSLKTDCQNFAPLADGVAAKVAQDLLVSINTARPTVEALIDAVYSDERKGGVEASLRGVRAEISSLVSAFVSDPEKRKAVLEGYGTLSPFWMQKPPANAYKEGPGGVPVLDEAKAIMKALRPFSDDPFAAFSDPSLSFFTDLNADYLPNVVLGKAQKSERVNMLPYFLNVRETDPHSFVAVLAHEAGHRIGPQVSRLNGFDLHPEYGELLACYRANESINLQVGQEDETVADYISSEVLARYLAKLPAADRQAAMASAMADLCSNEAGHAGVECRAAHPESSLRINGIYAANPHLRKAVGCEGSSLDFRPCAIGALSHPASHPGSLSTAPSAEKTVGRGPQPKKRKK